MISEERNRGRQETIDALIAVLRPKTTPGLITAIVEDLGEELAAIDRGEGRRR